MRAFFMYRKYGIQQGARDGGAVMSILRFINGTSVCHCSRDGGAVMYRKYGQIFASRHTASLLLRCSNKLLPCNDAISALPPSMVVVFRKELGKVVRLCL